MSGIYDQQLGRNAANFVALSPVSFVERSAEVFGDLPAVVHGARRYNWAQTRDRAARLAAWLDAPAQVDPPDDLDEDGLGAVYLLRPELAPVLSCRRL